MTNDLDIGLALAVLDDERYAEISARLRAEGFKPDTNDERVRVQNLEGDFGALITPGLQLAFDERVDIELEGHTLLGERREL